MKNKLKGIRWFLVAFVTCPCHLVFLIPLLAGTALGAYLLQYQTAASVILAILFATSLYLGWNKIFEEKADDCCSVKRGKCRK